jgi:hypothetical protein
MEFGALFAGLSWLVMFIGSVTAGGELNISAILAPGLTVNSGIHWKEV